MRRRYPPDDPRAQITRFVPLPDDLPLSLGLLPGATGPTGPAGPTGPTAP